jgi:hypothetical protein
MNQYIMRVSGFDVQLVSETGIVICSDNRSGGSGEADA